MALHCKLMTVEPLANVKTSNISFISATLYGNSCFHPRLINKNDNAGKNQVSSRKHEFLSIIFECKVKLVLCCKY